MRHALLLSAFFVSLLAPGLAWGQYRPQGWPSPGPMRQSVGYRGITVTRALPGSEPAADQLRAYPLAGGPVAVAGVPGDPASKFVLPYQPDVTFRGPSPYTAAYGGTIRGRQRILPPPPGGSALPLVLYGGFGESAMPVEDTYPVFRVYAGYYGSVAPVYATPPGGTDSVIVPTGP